MRRMDSLTRVLRLVARFREYAQRLEDDNDDPAATAAGPRNHDDDLLALLGLQRPEAELASKSS